MGGWGRAAVRRGLVLPWPQTTGEDTGCVMGSQVAGPPSQTQLLTECVIAVKSRNLSETPFPPL